MLCCFCNKILSIKILRTDISSSIGINNDSVFNSTRNESTIMKKMLLALTLCIMICTGVHAQQTIIVQHPGILTEIATATSTIISLPFALAEGVVVGSAEVVGSIFHDSAEVIVVQSATPVPTPLVIASPQPVQPSTTITTRYSDGSVVQVTKPASAYELGSVILLPVDPNHRVGSSPHVNPYIYRPR